MALVGNKDDMYQLEEVTYDEGLAFAKELNAIYKRTSAKSPQGGGIDDLFKIIFINNKIIYIKKNKINMSEQEEGARGCKVVFIGESGVGKTSIISRYITNSFKSEMVSTLGANFVTKNVIMEDENQSIKFEIWDTAGQERYRALTKVFYKNAAVCILVYDITKRKTFDELKKFWVKEIKENSLPDLSKK